MSLRLKATVYNLINIGSVIFFTFIFVLQILLYPLSSALIAGLVSRSIIAIIAIYTWPFIVMLLVLGINKFRVKRYIHKQTEKHYIANNINVDKEEDDGSLTDWEKSLLPNFPVTRGYNTVTKFDMKAFGEMSDLKIKYYIDTFSHEVKRELHNSFKPLNTRVKYGSHVKYRNHGGRVKYGAKNHETQQVLSYSGDALIAEFENINFGEKPIIFANTNMIKKMKLPYNLPPNKYKVGDLGLIYCYSEEVDIRILQKISVVISKEYSNFPPNAVIYVIFAGNRMIILSNGGKYKIKVPFLIHKSKIEEILSGQKAKIYNFNMLLNKISTIFY